MGRRAPRLLQVIRQALFVALLAGLAALPGLAQGRPPAAKAAQDPWLAETKPVNPALQRRADMAAVKSWGYQLRRLDAAEISASPFDLIVIDYAPDRIYGYEIPFTAEDVARMKTKPDGSRRRVIAYLSIGEAERYRFYWNNDWYDPARKPAWLGEVNPRWDGNFPVKFWDPDWQSRILDPQTGYLHRILAAGFDGVYLDRADVFMEWAPTRPTAEQDMVRFIADLAASARAEDPHFLVIMQNAEELLASKTLREAVDGIAKEDLYFGADHAESANPPDMIQGSVELLRRAKKAGRRVFVVEYLSDPAKAARARAQAAKEGFLLRLAERSLGTLLLDVPDPQPAPPPAPPPAVAPPPR